MLNDDTFLAGPRGRRLLLEYALASEEHMAMTSPGNYLLNDAVADLSAKQEDDRSTGMSAFSRFIGDVGVSATELLEAYRAKTESASSKIVAEALAQTVLTPVTDDNLRNALSASVSSAYYWQSPDGTDKFLADSVLNEPLRRIAQWLLASSAILKWDQPLQTENQWRTRFARDSPSEAELSPEEVLDEWLVNTITDEATAAREIPADPTAPYSGSWWSAPPRSLTISTPAGYDDAPSELYYCEECSGDFAEADVTYLNVDEVGGKVFEITTVADWVTLCERYPLEVSASRRHDWFRVSSIGGPWVIPNWTSVSRDWSGVHLTTAAYLHGATRVVPVGDAYSMIAGWGPDETFWFHEGIRKVGSAVRWQIDENAPELKWRPVDCK